MGVRTWLLGLLIAGPLCAGAWWWLRPPESGVGAEDAAAGEPDAAGEDPAVLAAHGGARAKEGPLARVARATVAGEVRRSGQPAPARIQVFEVRREAFASRLFRGARAVVPPAEGVPPRPVAEAAAGPDGAFRLDLPAPATYLLLATGEGRGRAEVTLRTDGARLAVRLDLRGGAERLAGRALHADGRPFHGSVVVEPRSPDGPSAFVFGAVTTDDDGRFAAEGLEPGPHTVSAFVPGRWRATSRSVPVPQAGEFTFVVDEGTREVAGRVVDERDGRGVGGAVVTTMATFAGDLERTDGRAVTEADGRFRVRASDLRGEWRVDAEGFARFDAWRLSPPEGTVLELRLVRLARLSGRVTAEGDGTPVGGVTVYATQGDGGDVSQAVTDADGRYAMADVRPGEVTVFGWGNGWCSRDLESAQSQGFNPLSTTLAPDGAAVVDLTVRRAARATGRVTDASDAPVEGAQVMANRTGGRGGFLPLLAQDRAVATDAEGRFAVDTLLPDGSYRFEASAPSSSPAQSPPLRADAGTPLVVDLKLGAPRWVDVDVVEKEAGTPVPGVQVYGWQQAADGNWKGMGPATSGAGGRARLGPVPPGPVMLWATGEGYQAAEQPTVGGPEGSTADVQAKLTVVRTKFVQGVVRWSDGAPAAGLQIRVRMQDGEEGEQLGDDGRFRIACTTSDSTVEVSVLRPSEQGEPEVLTEARATPGGPPLTLALPGARPPRLVARVTDTSGRTVPYARMAIDAGAGAQWEGVSDGRAEFARPEAPFHVLLLAARGEGGPLPLGLTLAGPFDPKSGEVEVKMPPEQRIEGVVRTADGRPVRGACLRAAPKEVPAPFADFREDVATARSDDAGRFRLGGLGSGTYVVRVDAADRGGRTEPVEAKAGVLDLVITLGEGVEAVVTVVGPDGQPVAGATVRAQTPAARAVSAETDAAGGATLRGLDRKARYRLDVLPGETRPDVMPLAREAWVPRDEVLALAPAWAIEGVVRDGSGAPLADAWVDAIAGGNLVKRARVRGDGVFRVDRLAAGTYRLVARSQSPPRSSRAVTASAGARDAVLLLDPACALTLRIEGWSWGEQWTALWDEDTGTTTDWAQIDSEGTARFGSLHPEGRYTVCFVRESEGEAAEPRPTWVAWKSGIRGDAGSVAVPLERGATIGVRVLLPPGVSRVQVWATDGVVRRGASMTESTRGWVTGLHAGTWTVKASASSPQGALAAEARVDAGGSVELDLEPVR